MSLSFFDARFDPRTLIFLTLSFSVLVISVSSLQLSLGLFIFAFGLAVLFRVPLVSTFKKIMLLDGFMILALFSLPFTFASGPSLLIWGVPVYPDGFWLAVSIALKANSIFLCFTALMGRMGVAEFAHALAHLKVPAQFVQILLLMVRYVDVLRFELERMRTAMKCRGFQYSTSWHCWKSIGHLIGMLFVRSIERGEQILIAMKCRGFQGTFPLLHHFHYGRQDTFLILTFFSGLLLFLVFSSSLDFKSFMEFITYG
ncbi:MAG: cobalt ECF transporter T component CbiQ [Rhodomicrobiaceae bacterium]